MRVGRASGSGRPRSAVVEAFAIAAAALLAVVACGKSGGLRSVDPREATSPTSPRDGGAAEAADARALVLPDAASDAALDGPPSACALGADERGNAGCSFYPVPVLGNGCYVAYVVNPGRETVHLGFAFHGVAASLAQFARRPQRQAGATVLAPFDEAAGLGPGEALVIFINEARNNGSRAAGNEACPVPAISEHRGFDFFPYKESTGIGDAYHLTADRPVVAYQMYGYEREARSGPSTTLLWPEEAWGRTTVVATPKDAFEMWGPDVIVVAGQDDTEVRFRPSQDIVDVDDPSRLVRSGVTKTVHLAAGEFVQIAAKETRPFTPFPSAWPPLSGSIVSASKPVGVIGLAAGFAIPLGTEGGAAHQQLPPLEALGNEYVAVRYPDRLPTVDEETPWQIVGAADGTALTYLPAPPKDAPLTLGVGQVAHFWSKTPFIVRSQDDRHPFFLAAYMTGPGYLQPDSDVEGPGHPLFVNAVPTAQYDRSYVFFTEPSFPETRLVVVRSQGVDGRFAEVKLACASAPLTGFTALGAYEYAQVTLVSGDKPALAGCDNGVHAIESSAPFAVTVWGWGGPRANPNHTVTDSGAYGYPAGARAHPVNHAPPIVID